MVLRKYDIYYSEIRLKNHIPFMKFDKVHTLFKVLTIVEKIMDEVIADNRANRDFRVKFPDDVLQESLAGQLWFGAEVRELS